MTSQNNIFLSYNKLGTLSYTYMKENYKYDNDIYELKKNLSFLNELR